MADYTLRTPMRRIATLLALLLLAGLACNAPLEPDNPEPPVEDGSTGLPEDKPADDKDEDPAEDENGAGSSPATVPAAESATPQPTAAETPSATPQPSPTAGATPTKPPATATRTPRPRPSATATTGSSGPLDFSYNISWVLAPNNPQIAIATITINATGGGGGYRYYRDDLEVSGPIFSYEWGSCRANPGSLRVDSSDGQSKKVDYFSAPPCPTPTPTS